MGTPGAFVILPSGKRAVSASGKFLVYNADGECPECCGTPCGPCDGDNPALPSSLAVGGGSYTECPDEPGGCGGASPSESREWDNTLEKLEGSCVYVFSGDPLTGLIHIGGSDIDELSLSWNEGECKWEFTIGCSNGGVIWSGEKAGNPSDPTGTYTRTAGCDMTATRTIS